MCSCILEESNWWHWHEFMFCRREFWNVEDFDGMVSGANDCVGVCVFGGCRVWWRIGVERLNT